MDEEVIPILRVEDARCCGGGLVRAPGLHQAVGTSLRAGAPAFVEVARDRVRLFLSEHQGDARPGTSVYLRVSDVDAVAAEFGVPVEDAPWAREIELRDPDGNRLRVGTSKQ